ncbi:hypothetical protein ACFL1R_10335 [Candidatus Latescibacterota bacterium]
MRKSFFISIALILCVFFVSTYSVANQAHIIENYGKIPLAFTVNQGQFDPQVKFTTRGSGCTMFFTPTSTTYLLSHETKESISRSAKKTVWYIWEIFQEEMTLNENTNSFPLYCDNYKIHPELVFFNF